MWKKRLNWVLLKEWSRSNAAEPERKDEKGRKRRSCGITATAIPKVTGNMGPLKWEVDKHFERNTRIRARKMKVMGENALKRGRSQTPKIVGDKKTKQKEGKEKKKKKGHKA